MVRRSKGHRLNVGSDDRVVLIDVAIPGASIALLTRAERGVALLAAEGLSNAQIAARRRVSVKTVANQLARIYAKLGARSRFELAMLLSRA